MPHSHISSPRNAPGSVKPEPPAPRKRQLLVDVTHTSLHDFKTGIQRVVRGLLFELIRHPPEGFRVEAVYVPPEGKRFFYARDFLYRLGLRTKGADDPVRTWTGDLLLIPENNYDAVLNHPEMFQALRRAGVKTYSIIYDLIPITLPNAFAPAITLTHARWLAKIAEGDGLICISRAVADDVGAWLDQHGPSRKSPLPIGWFHLGADLEGSIPSRGLPEDAEARLSAFRSKPTFLMVGTLEPRKGHRQVMAAFDLLWAQGLDLNLVFVGREGWQVEKLSRQLRHTHPERNQRLFWIEGASDEYLAEIYATTACLLFPSQAEGFGLPLIEAAQRGLPILARDLPVFREVAADFATYFEGFTAEALATRVQSWLEAWRAKTIPDSRGLPWLTWEDSTQSLLRVILEGNWYRTWEPTRRSPTGTVPQTMANVIWARTIGVDARILWTEDSERTSARRYTLCLMESLAALQPSWRFVMFVDVPPHEPQELVGLLRRPNVEVCPIGDLRARGLDLFHFPETPPGTFPSLARMLPDGLPTTTVVRGLEFLTKNQGGGRDYRLPKGPGQALLTTTEAIRQRMIALMDLRPEHLSSILEGQPHADTSPSDIQRVKTEWGLEHPFFLIQGDLSPEHDIGMAFAAFKSLVKSRLAHLVILGGLGDKKVQMFRKQVHAFGIDQILFVGTPEAEDLAALHRAAVAFLCPGFSRAFPSPVLQAMSLGCPIIAYPEGAVPEVAGTGAVWIPLGDVEAMTQAMSELIDCPQLADDLRARGQQRAALFTWDVVARRTVRCWARLWALPSGRHRNNHPVEPKSVIVRWEGTLEEWEADAVSGTLAQRGLVCAWERCEVELGSGEASEAKVHVRHQWPPNLTPPASGCWVVSFPKGVEGLAPAWTGILREEVDEIWVADWATRERCLEAGIPPDRVPLPPETPPCLQLEWMADRVTSLVGREPRRKAASRPDCAQASTAFSYRVDWREVEWIEIVLAFVSAFEPGEAVALVLEIPGGEGEPTVAEAEHRIVDLISRVKRIRFPRIILLGPGESLESVLQGFSIREVIPRGRGAIQGLVSFVGLRFAGTRLQLTKP